MNDVPVAGGAGRGALLSVEGLTVGFRTGDGFVRVLDDVGFSVAAGETVGLVGESGCGKSVSAMSIMRLVPTPPAVIEGGRILFDGIDLLALDAERMRAVRGDRIGMIFQEPMTSLNPTFTIGFQIAEVLKLHRGLDRASAERESVAMLQAVGIGAAERRLAQYPHQLSGGLRQRVMIAMALVCGPKLLIADEPTTALDVTIQAQILDLLRRLQRQMGMAVLLITHDLGVVAEMCDRVVVMYAGRIVERCATADLFHRPRHPYSAGLLAATPRRAKRGERLVTIPGMVPAPGKRGAGCPFADRCARAIERCRIEMPPLAAVDGAAVAGPVRHESACWNPVPLRGAA
jgi:oligopeptide/dipeptide ABC transporter ATP-binding protein